MGVVNGGMGVVNLKNAHKHEQFSRYTDSYSMQSANFLKY